MPTELETLRGFVNTWDCDENAHMNVQHYFRFFDDASRIFSRSEGTGSGGDAPPRTRHVRFHAELFAGASIRIVSAQIAEGPFAGWIVHRMENVQTAVLAASALEPQPETKPGHRADSDFARRALPRSLAAEPETPQPAGDMIAAGGLVSHRRIVRPAECGADGVMLEQFHISCFTDGAPHLWEHARIGTDWLTANNFGRAAVEMKITHHAPVHAGEALALYSRPVAVSGKTIRFRHELVAGGDSRPVASGEVIGLVFDLTTRKSVDMPEIANAGFGE